jgi:hypothetical protein
VGLFLCFDGTELEGEHTMRHQYLYVGLCFAVLGVLIPVLAHAQTQKLSYRAASDVARQFCRFMDGKNRDIFAPQFRDLVTSDLFALIQKAERKNTLIAQTYPDMKPPLGDGIPYQSFPDYAPHCIVSALNYQRYVGMATISYRFPETPEANWSDHLRLKKQNGVWRIDNIVYGRNYARTTLRDVLQQVSD